MFMEYHAWRVLEPQLGGGFKYIFYFHPYLGRWSNLPNIFQMGCFNHQLATIFIAEAQANVELRDGSMNTPLLSATSHGHVEAGTRRQVSLMVLRRDGYLSCMIQSHEWYRHAYNIYIYICWYVFIYTWYMYIEYEILLIYLSKWKAWQDLQIWIEFANDLEILEVSWGPRCSQRFTASRGGEVLDVSRGAKKRDRWVT